MPPKRKSGVCCFYLRGRCSYRQKCKFSHTDNGGPCIYGPTCKHHLNRGQILSVAHDDDSEDDFDDDDDHFGAVMASQMRNLSREMASMRMPPVATVRPPSSTMTRAMGPTVAVDPRPPQMQSRSVHSHSSASECVICDERKQLVKTTNSCRHPPSLCTACVEEHISVQVNDGKTTINCPLCPTLEMQTEAIQKFASPKVFAKYDELLLKRMLSCDSTHIHCCNSKCGASFFVEDGVRSPVVRCPNCNMKMCFNCQAPWHSGMSCEEYKLLKPQSTADRKTEEYLQRETRKCPRCGVGPCSKEKAECDIATCPRCAPRFRFCWECFADYDLILKTDCRNHKPSCRYHA